MPGLKKVSRLIDGGAGSINVSPFTGTDTHPLAAVMVRLSYIPADRFEMTMLPDVSEESEAGDCGVPSKLKFTVKEVLTVKPVSVILPSEPPHVDGCVIEEPPITGAGVVLMLTDVVSGRDEHESIFAITMYMPDIDDCTLVIAGFCCAEL